MDLRGKLMWALLGAGISMCGLCLIFGIPNLIDLMFKYGDVVNSTNTKFSASDVLQYYGTLLGAAATIIAVTLTIIYSSKSAKKDRNNSQNIAHREFGVRLCLELIDSCDYSKVYDFFISLQSKGNEEFMAEEKMFDLTILEINNIMTMVEKNKKNFYIYYPDLKKTTTEQIDKFIEFYKDILWEMHENAIIKNEGINLDLLLKKRELHKPRYEIFCDLIRDEVFSYNFDKHDSIN